MRSEPELDGSENRREEGMATKKPYSHSSIASKQPFTQLRFEKRHERYHVGERGEKVAKANSQQSLGGISS